TKLLVRTGLGNNWNTTFIDQLSVGAASAPAICRLDERYFLIVWNNGGGGIGTALLDSDNMGRAGNAFTRLNDINDTLAQHVEGTPSLSALNNLITVVWRSHHVGNPAKEVVSVGHYSLARHDVQFGNSRELHVTPASSSSVPQVVSI